MKMKIQFKKMTALDHGLLATLVSFMAFFAASVTAMHLVDFLSGWPWLLWLAWWLSGAYVSSRFGLAVEAHIKQCERAGM